MGKNFFGWKGQKVLPKDSLFSNRFRKAFSLLKKGSNFNMLLVAKEPWILGIAVP